MLGPLFLTVATAAFAQPYSSRRGGDVVQLQDARTQTIVSILPSVGDIAFEMNVKGQNILYWPYASIEEFKARPGMSGIPFLGPWADRLDEQAFFANGRKFAFDMQLGNVRGDMPIHGFVTTTDRWSVVEAQANTDGAWVTSRLEFYRQPIWMKQWPFAHTIEITHRLHDGVLEVKTTIVNLSAEPMRAVTLWSPKEWPFICVEPTAGIINALNLAARGLYKDLQSVAPGGTWRERFWIKASGF